MYVGCFPCGTVVQHGLGIGLCRALVTQHQICTDLEDRETPQNQQKIMYATVLATRQDLWLSLQVPHEDRSRSGFIVGPRRSSCMEVAQVQSG